MSKERQTNLVVVVGPGEDTVTLTIKNKKIGIINFLLYYGTQVDRKAVGNKRRKLTNDHRGKEVRSISGDSPGSVEDVSVNGTSHGSLLVHRQSCKKNRRKAEQKHDRDGQLYRSNRK